MVSKRTLKKENLKLKQEIIQLRQIMGLVVSSDFNAMLVNSGTNSVNSSNFWNEVALPKVSRMKDKLKANQEDDSTQPCVCILVRTGVNPHKSNIDKSSLELVEKRIFERHLPNYITMSDKIKSSIVSKVMEYIKREKCYKHSISCISREFFKAGESYSSSNHQAKELLNSIEYLLPPSVKQISGATL